VKGLAESVPFDLYETFVIEDRHGFNKQSFAVWLSDQVSQSDLRRLVYEEGFVFVY